MPRSVVRLLRCGGAVLLELRHDLAEVLGDVSLDRVFAVLFGLLGALAALRPRCRCFLLGSGEAILRLPPGLRADRLGGGATFQLG